MSKSLCPILFLVALLGFNLHSQAAPRTKASIEVPQNIKVEENTHYCPELTNEPGGKLLLMDIYKKENNPKNAPAAIIIHGGGWNGRDKAHKNFVKMSTHYANKGFVVFNINYRLASVATAPAAVQDVKCAASFIQKNADKYGIDSNRVLATGNSAGCHLGLMAAMCNDKLCTGDGKWSAGDVNIKAVVNRFAMTDVYERTFGKQSRKSALRWIGGKTETHKNLAKKMSPLQYVKEKNLPAILNIHGAKDSNTPVKDAINLHKGLLENGNKSTLLVVQNGGHGLHNLSPEDEVAVENTIDEFLKAQGFS